MKVIEVYRNTSKAGTLQSVQCTIDGVRAAVSREEWVKMVRDPKVEISLSEKEGVWPGANTGDH